MTVGVPGRGGPLWLPSQHIHHTHLEVDLKMKYLPFPRRAEAPAVDDLGSAITSKILSCLEQQARDPVITAQHETSL